MEAPTPKKAETNQTPEDEQMWRKHVAYAENFLGSNAEYCRRNRIDHRLFRSYKKKFGTTKSRILEPKAFVKIEGSTSRVSSEQVTHPSERTLPDPKWTAEFIAALMRATK